MLESSTPKLVEMRSREPSKLVKFIIGWSKVVLSFLMIDGLSAFGVSMRTPLARHGIFSKDLCCDEDVEP